ncbi:unnamed protein product, partial [Owenia fusiformis]
IIFACNLEMKSVHLYLQYAFSASAVLSINNGIIDCASNTQQIPKSSLTASQSSTYYEFNDNHEKIPARASLAIDGDTTTCARSNGDEEPTFTIVFDRDYYVHSIRITVGALPYTYFGCFGETGVDRALGWYIENEDIPYLHDDYWNRVLEVKKCFAAITANNSELIGVLNGGFCVTSTTGYKTYDK